MPTPLRFTLALVVLLIGAPTVSAADMPHSNAAPVVVTPPGTYQPPPPPPYQNNDPSYRYARAVGRTHECGAYFQALSTIPQFGAVQLSYDVEADGRLTNVTLVKSSGLPDLDQAAIDCVATIWRTEPATLHGVPVAERGHQAIVQWLEH